jgi:uncharacterized protein (TIGR02996 family)
MKDLESLYAALIENMNDVQTRGVLADWYEEYGNHKHAEAIRWMIENNKRPYKNNAIPPIFALFNAETVTTDTDIESNIPPLVFKKLKGGQERIENVFREYPSLKEAEEDFYQAWVQVKDEGNLES